VCREIYPSEKYCQICASAEIKETPVDFILGESYQEINLNEVSGINQTVS
jgi:lipopolysaccharide biosynthesis protein